MAACLNSLYLFFSLFEGKGKVRWTEQESYQRDGKTQHRTVTYSEEETYFSFEYAVFNGPSLPSGIHYFPFNFTLPCNIPR